MQSSHGEGPDLWGVEPQGSFFASTQQQGGREITVKDNPKNVIAVPSAPESSESPAPVVGLSHGPQSFRPRGDQSLLRRREVPQSISGS